jgi:hypothetical protein
LEEPLPRRTILIAGLALACLAAYAQQPKSDDKAAASRTLKVKLNYTGAGKVDAKHKIFVFFFDNPDFISGAQVMPFARQEAVDKSANLTVSDVTAEAVYMVAAFDPKGGYDGESGPPPSGSSLGIYGKNPPSPDPVKIEAGKTAEIELAFDDSFPMP